MNLLGFISDFHSRFLEVVPKYVTFYFKCFLSFVRLTRFHFLRRAHSNFITPRRDGVWNSEYLRTCWCLVGL